MGTLHQYRTFTLDPSRFLKLRNYSYLFRSTPPYSRSPYRHNWPSPIGSHDLIIMISWTRHGSVVIKDSTERFWNTETSSRVQEDSICTNRVSGVKLRKEGTEGDKISGLSFCQLKGIRNRKSSSVHYVNTTYFISLFREEVILPFWTFLFPKVRSRSRKEEEGLTLCLLYGPPLRR